MIYKETDWENYRPLIKGEVIQLNDEIYEDGKGWRKTVSAGGTAPDPSFISHRQYRRRINQG